MRGCATDTCNPYIPYHHQWMRNRKLLTFPARFPFPPTCGAAAAVRWSHWQLNKSMETGSTDSENSPPDATHQRRGGHLTVQRQWCARVEVGSNRAPPHAHSAPRPSVFFLRAIQSTRTKRRRKNVGLDAARGCELVPWTTTAPLRTHTIRHGHRPTQTFLHSRATLFYFYFVSMKTTHPTTSSRNNSNFISLSPLQHYHDDTGRHPNICDQCTAGYNIDQCSSTPILLPPHHSPPPTPPPIPRRPTTELSHSNDWTAGTLATPFPCTTDTVSMSHSFHHTRRLRLRTKRVHAVPVWNS